MVAKGLAVLTGLLCLSAGAAYADGSSGACVDISVPKGAVASHNGRWIELTNQQWEFMRGVYAMHPSTPLSLPFGDKAVLAQLADEKGGVVFFVDGVRACTPMMVPAEVVALMRDVAMDTIMHEEPGL
jgi:hypothetical protein